MARAILVTGCSGGGKSTLVEALRTAGHRVVDEPGRRIVAGEHASGGAALPWTDPLAFARRALAMARGDLLALPPGGGTAFFDRGLVDAAVALEHLTGHPAARALDGAPRYDRHVFVAPPWPELFATDGERRHGFAEAAAEHDRIVAALPHLGYEAVTLPQIGVAQRVAFVLARTSIGLADGERVARS